MFEVPFHYFCSLKIIMSDETNEVQRAFCHTILDLSEKHQADIILFDADIEKPQDKLLFECCNQPAYENVLLFLTTAGGNPDVAYRIARYLQEKYRKFTVYVDTYCKSAGTLITLGADEVIMSDRAELGPLDVQLLKPDELEGRDSGLDLIHALERLKETSYEVFEGFFWTLWLKGGGQISSKSALKVAIQATSGLLGPVYHQIEPMKLGQFYRAMEIAEAYGKRLNTRGNLKPEALHRLIYDYPSHSFVIDRSEAEQFIFESVREPNEQEAQVVLELRQIPHINGDQEVVIHNFTKTYLEKEDEKEDEKENSHGKNER
jgi:hypothetical protein